MKILEATVESTIDPESEGKFTATANGVLYEVHYTSPWGSVGQKKGAGFFAIPSEQQSVLIIQPDQSSTWYLLSVIQSGPFVGESKVPKQLYEKREVPQQLVIRDPVGNELVFSHSYKKTFNHKIQMKTGTGKKLIFHDSPTISEVRLENERGDGILIRGKTATKFASFPPPPAARSIQVKSSGPVSITSRRSSLDISIEDGKDIPNSDLQTRYDTFINCIKRFCYIKFNTKRITSWLAKI